MRAVKRLLSGFVGTCFLPVPVFAEELKPFRPPQQPPENWIWMFVFLILLLCVALAAFWFWRKRNPKILAAVLVQPPWDKALERLEALAQEDLPQKGQIKEFFVRVCGIVRYYIEERFQARAPEMTTEEFLAYLKTTTFLDAGQKQYLREFLDLSDLVKFARHGASRDECDQAYLAARRLVSETKPRDPEATPGHS